MLTQGAKRMFFRQFTTSEQHVIPLSNHKHYLQLQSRREFKVSSLSTDKSSRARNEVEMY